MSEPAQSSSTALVALTDTERYLAEHTGTDFRVTPEGWKVIGLPPTLKQRFNLGVTTTQIVQVDANYSPLPRIVHLDLEEHWYQESGAWAITAKGLDLLSEAAGITWDDPDIDASAHSLFVTARGRRRGPDGTIEPFSDTKGGRYADMERKVRRERKASLRKTAGYQNGAWAQKILDDPERLEEELDKAWDDFVEHASAKIATKARNRVVRHWLGIKSTYTQAEKAKPFLVVRWVVTPDYANPHVGKVIGAQFGAARGALYAVDADEPAQLAAPSARPEPAAIAGHAAEPEPEVDDLPASFDDDPEEEVVDAVPVSDGAGTIPMNLDSDDEIPVDDDDDARPPKPEQPYKFRNGPYSGQHIEAVMEEAEGLLWVLQRTHSLRAGKTRDTLLAWISHNMGTFVAFEELESLADRVKEDAEP